MMSIKKDLESKGWKIDHSDEIYIFAERKSTGKLACFIPASLNIPQIEIMRVWTKKKKHPFLFQEKEGKIIYFDCLSNDQVKNP